MDLDPQTAEPLLRAIFAASSDAIGVSEDGRAVMVNPALVALFGYDQPSEIVGRPVLDLIAPGGRELVGELTRRREMGEAVPGSYRTRGLRRDGTEFPMEVRSVSTRLGERTQVLSLLRDVSDEDAAADAVRKSEDFYRALFEVNPAVKLLIDPTTGRLVDVNPAAVEFYGWSRDELLRMSITDINQLSEDEVKAEMENARSGRRRYFRFRHATSSGEIRHVEVHSGPVEIDGHSLLLSIVHDVTDRNRLEHQLREAQRLESVGRLAGGVAHDFNNLLTVMITSADLLQRRLERESPLRLYVEDMSHAAARAAELTQALLAFSRRQLMAPAVLDLNQLMERMERLVRRITHPTLEVQVELTSGGLHAYADPSQLEHAVMNLALNARDAMPDGGTLTMSTHARDDDEGRAWVGFSIADTGIGMDEATRQRVFEPFFTTKPLGAGTGLGLSSVYGIVTQSGGRVTVASAPDQGTRFTVELPATAETPAPPLTPPIIDSPHGGGRTVLLVDDVPAVRKALIGVLERAGFRVLSAGSVEQALPLLSDEVGALVTDVVMPGRSGIELAREVLGRRPSLLVVLISGDVRGHDLEGLPETVVFLQKPFRPEQLLQALGRATPSTS
ncbi:MAG TPA: PAS domain S-box protein [Kofleriaceae bacterium]|nr:PAS domain S-box protein [Kofleriaceae bacterium]